MNSVEATSHDNDNIERTINDEPEWIQRMVAGDRRTRGAILGELSNSSDVHVKRSLASNNNTPIAVLDKLAGDKDDIVRRKVVENMNTPMATLTRLANDKIRSVATIEAERQIAIRKYIL